MSPCPYILPPAEGSTTAHELAGRLAVGQLEVSTEGVERHVCVRPVQLVRSAQVQDALVVGREADGVVAAAELAAREGDVRGHCYGDEFRIFVSLTERIGNLSGGGLHGDTVEYGIHEVAGAVAVPLDDERCTGRDNPPLLPRGGYLLEVQRQRRAAQSARRGVQCHGCHTVAGQWLAGDADIEGQAQRVPVAVLALYFAAVASSVSMRKFCPLSVAIIILLFIGPAATAISFDS